MRPLLTLVVAELLATFAFAQSNSNGYIFSTFAGRAAASGSADGTVADARFNRPWGLAFDGAGNLFVTDASNHTVRKITPDGIVSTIAGQTGIRGTIDGPAGSALFGAIGTSPSPNVATGPYGIVVGAGGNLYVSDANVHVLRLITPGGLVSTYSGTAGDARTFDGSLALARYNYPVALAMDRAGTLYFTDTYSHVIRKISKEGQVTTIAGIAGLFGSADGVGTASRFLYPSAICVSPAGNLYVTDSANTVRRLSRVSGAGEQWSVTTIAGAPLTYGATNGAGAEARFGGPPSTTASVVVRHPSFGPPGPAPVNLGLSYTVGDLPGLAVDASENVFVSDFSNNLIRKISPGGVVTTIGGAVAGGSLDGAGTAALFQRPTGIAVDENGNLYIADFLNGTIRKGAQGAAPTLVAQSISQAVGLGASVTLSMTASGTPPPSYRWSRDGFPIAGATRSTLELTNILPGDAGSYTATASNGFGFVTSGPMVLTVTAGPVILTQPASQNLIGGQTATLSVVVSAAPVPTYQWLLNGNPLPGQTGSSLVLANVQDATAGSYTVTVTNVNGVTTSGAAVVSVDTGRLVNLSIRSAVTGSDSLIVGFVLAGGSKPLLIRAIGPTLRQFGVSGAMADPQLTLEVGGAVFAANDNWFSAPNATQLALAATQVGAFPLTDTNLDAAAYATISSNQVTAAASARTNTGGVVLLELYDAGGVSPGRLVNVSARAMVGVGEDALFAGFTVGGNSPRTLLMRAIGPTLAPFGVSGVLADPLLEVFPAGGAVARATNDNWNGDPALSAAFSRVGAFPLPAGTSKDAVLIATFEPGVYSAKISGVGNTTGQALLEIYELP